MKEATYDFHTAFELNSGIAQTFIQVKTDLANQIESPYTQFPTKIFPNCL